MHRRWRRGSAGWQYPPGPDMGLSGPIWVWVGRRQAWLSGVRWLCVELVVGGGSIAGVQQCGGQDFAIPIWARPGPGGLVCLGCGVRSAILVGAAGRGLRREQECLCNSQEL
ncbi:hypothetical protein ACQJBY_060185 [Aegilops geniculata]